MVRILLLLVMALGACDLRPPPPKTSAPPTTATPTALPPPPPSLSDAGMDEPASTPDAMETSLPCNEVGTKIAASIIEGAQDPQQKSQLQQERDRIVRRVAEACTRDQWTAPQRECFLKATTPETMQECGRDLAAPRDD